MTTRQILKDNLDEMPERLESHCYESDKGELVIWASMPDGDGIPVVVERHRIQALVNAAMDALASKNSRY